MLIVASGLVVLVVWIAVGLVVARRQGLEGSAALGVVARGPLGLLGDDDAVGSVRAGSDPTTYYDDADGDDLHMPVLVDVDGEWRHGTLQRWTTEEGGWQAWVDYEVDGAREQGWFGGRAVRPRPDSTSD